MAFQIKDDLFDYSEDRVGKPTGIDIRERKMTLPFLHVLEKASASQKKWLIDGIKSTIKKAGQRNYCFCH